MFTLLKYLFRNTVQEQTGALLDTRKPDEKKEDIHFKDIVAYANEVKWQEKTSWKTYPVLNQNSSLMCGANALAKYLGAYYKTVYENYIAFSRAHIYNRRMNRPGGGMALADVFRIASEGVTLEQLTPGDIYSDLDVEKIVIENFKHKVGEVFAVSGGVYLPPNDIDTMASVMQTANKPIILLTYFNAGEWSKQYPVIIDKTLREEWGLRHFVTAVDFGLIKGIKNLKIDDSAHFGGFSERWLSEDWIKNRVYGAGYLMNFKFLSGSGNKPIYDGITIVSAQKCLRFEGLFAINISFVENIGPLTRKALLAFQSKYKIPQTGLIDKATKKLLHSLYS